MTILALFAIATVLAPIPSAEEQATTAQTCDAIQAELTTLRARRDELMNQLQGAIGGVEQNARNGAAVAQTGTALNWATGIASMVPGVGYAASAAGAAATQQALMAQQRNTTTVNARLAEVVQQLSPLGERINTLETDAAARGC